MTIPNADKNVDSLLRIQNGTVILENYLADPYKAFPVVMYECES